MGSHLPVWACSHRVRATKALCQSGVDWPHCAAWTTEKLLLTSNDWTFLRAAQDLASGPWPGLPPVSYWPDLYQMTVTVFHLFGSRADGGAPRPQRAGLTT